MVNYALLGIVFALLFYRSEKTNERKYYVFMTLAVIVAVLDYRHYNTLPYCNTISIITLLMYSLGILEL